MEERVLLTKKEYCSNRLRLKPLSKLIESASTDSLQADFNEKSYEIRKFRKTHAWVAVRHAQQTSIYLLAGSENVRCTSALTKEPVR